MMSPPLHSLRFIAASTRFLSRSVSPHPPSFSLSISPCRRLHIPCFPSPSHSRRCRISGVGPRRWLTQEVQRMPWPTGKGHEENSVHSTIKVDSGHKPESGSLHTNFEELAMVGLDAMQRSKSTLEDFCRRYFMFHGMDENNAQSLFQYLPILSFTECYIYLLDTLNEKTLHAPSSEMTILERGTEVEGQGLIARFANVFKSDPFRPLSLVYESQGVLTKRIQDELNSGVEYWALERKLCCALMNKAEISIEDVIEALHLKGTDYRVMNLLLYQLRGEEVNELHMEFLAISEFLVEVEDDVLDYEEDVMENNFNTLRLFVQVYGASASTELTKYITEAEEKYINLLEMLDPQLALKHEKRCEEATKEGGIYGGAWCLPSPILDEESYRSSVLDQNKQL